MKRLAMTEGNYVACVSDPPDKTQTRRRIKEQPAQGRNIWDGAVLWRWKSEPIGYDYDLKRKLGSSAPYAVGDVVALTLPHWRAKLWRNGLDEFNCPEGIIQIFDVVTGRMRATDGAHAEGFDTDKEIATGAYTRMAARFMPAWACLHFAEIVAVRAERLGEISDEDCLREGIHFRDGAGWVYPGQEIADECCPESRSLAYRAEWEALHGMEAWSPNEWVWVRDFKLCANGEGNP